MHAEVKKCAEAHDIKGLRYIFVDCLDVDPTFEKYKEDYEYCKSIEGLFDTHQPLHGTSMDGNDWTLNYWEQLKLDLMKNFSRTRFEHMIVVAKVVYADKISRLLRERSISQGKQTDGSNNIIDNENVQTTSAKLNPTVKANDRSSDVSAPNSQKLNRNIVMDDSRLISDAKSQQEKKLAEKRHELEAENQRIEEEQAAQKARIEAARRESANRQNVTDGETKIKKALGIVLAVIAVVVVVVVIIIMVLH